MKKDRNTFFNEASFSQSGFIPNMPMPQYSGQASQSFYAGMNQSPNMNTNFNPNQGMGGNDFTSDIESRLSKIERQINRMDARISKLESKDFASDTTLNNNMYML